MFILFYGACVQSSIMLLVAELMEGGDLRTALDRDTTGRFRWWQQGKSIAVDVARGVAFLHSSGVIHRDLKSANVLLTEAGSAKIADVGLAKMVGGEWRPGRDQVFGTLSFAAPEVLLGERTTEKVDIYSLGVVLWEIATSAFPQVQLCNLPWCFFKDAAAGSCQAARPKVLCIHIQESINSMSFFPDETMHLEQQLSVCCCSAAASGR